MKGSLGMKLFVRLFDVVGVISPTITSGGIYIYNQRYK